MASSLPSSPSPPGTEGELAHLRFASAIACLLLGLMAVLAGGAAWRESVTFDEMAHIGAGVSYVQKLDLRFNEEHPPLVKVLAGIPLALVGTHVDYSHISWTNSTKFVPNNFLGQWVFGEWVISRWNNPQQVLFWARLPMLLVMLGLGWTIFVCSRKIGGDAGGLLALSAYVSSPIFLGFGPLVHTDVAVTLFCLLTLWQFANLWQEPSWRTAVCFSLCLAGALLSKFSAGLLFVAFGALAVSTRLMRLPGLPQKKEELRAWRRNRWVWTQRGVALAAIMVYAFYFFFSLRQSTDALSLIGHSARWAPVRRLLMPPWLYLRGLLMFVATSSRPTFLAGRAYPHGVWFYYPVLLALKMPLGFLGLVALLLVLAVGLQARHRRVRAVPEAEAWHWRAIWVGLVIFAAACMLSQFSISIRHFSVPIILLTVMLAPLPRMIQRLVPETRNAARAAGSLAVLLAGSSLVSAIRAYPYYLPFFNSLTHSHPVYWWASDSNVDWNQALLEVKDFADRRGLKELEIDNQSMADPVAYVPQARVWDCQAPTADDSDHWVVVSSDMILDQHNCSWLMQYPHEMVGGGSMWAVHLPPVIPAAGTRGGPPPIYARRICFGMNEDPRVANIKLTNHPELLPEYCAAAEAQIRKYFGR